MNNPAHPGECAFIAELSARGFLGTTAWIITRIDSDAGPIVAFAEHPEKAKQGLSVTNGAEQIAGAAFSTFPFLADLDPTAVRIAETYMFDQSYDDAGLLKRYRLDEVRFDSVERVSGAWRFARPSWHPKGEAEQAPLLVRLRELAAAVGLLPPALNSPRLTPPQQGKREKGKAR